MRDILSKSGAFIVAFDSLAEAMEYADKDTYCWERHSESFVGENLPSWEKVEERALKSWEEGMALLKVYRDRLKDMPLPKLKARQQFTAWQHDEGDEFDHDRFMQGLPPWRSKKREAGDGPACVTIVIDTTSHAGRASTDLFWRGAAALALAEILDEKGYGTEIWVINGSTAFGYDKEPLVLAANLKRPGDAFDISTLTNAVAGWFYRTVTFTLIRTVGRKFNRHIIDGLGCEYIPVVQDLNCLTSDTHRVYSAGYYSFNGALDKVKFEIEAIGVAEENAENGEQGKPAA